MAQEIGERGDGAAHVAPPNYAGRSTAHPVSDRW
jgi:hypothetical protein